MGELSLDQPPDRVSKLLRRAMRLTETEVRPNFEHPLGLQYLIVAFWTQALAERGSRCDPVSVAPTDLPRLA